ncbi:MAG: hypothetical protein WC558_05315 [Patulibacter sp.]
MIGRRSVTIFGLAVACTLPLAACGGSDGERASEPVPPGVAGAAPSGPAADVIPQVPVPSETTPSPDVPEQQQTSPMEIERASARPSRRGRWPATLQIGLIDPEDHAAGLRESAPFGVRWHYLSGGAATGSSWTTWRNGGGSFATAYSEESRAAKTIPFFSYYVLQETPPASRRSAEPDKVADGLSNPLVVRRVVTDIRQALQRLGQAGGPAVLQIEPDMWGYLQQRFGDDASNSPVRLKGSSRFAKGLSNDLRGFARLVTRIRDAEAPNVLLAYPVSIFGTHKDIKGSRPDAAELDTMVQRSVRFWRSAGSPFDLMTFEHANRNAGYQIKVDGVASEDARWTNEDHQRHLSYVRGVLAASKRPGVLWQVPPGNTVRPEMDDTPGHYTDDKVQTLLGRKGRPLLRSYRDAGVVMVLFGSAFPSDTCACVRRDEYARADGEHDDGGYLAAQVRSYVKDGPLKVRRVPKRINK